MARGLRFWVILTSVAGFVLLGVVSWVSYHTTRELIAANQRLTEKRKAIEELTSLHLLLDDAESSSRGYALTGRPEYLHTYSLALAQLDSTRQIVRHDFSSTASHRRGLAELDALIDARLTVMQELIRARQEQGFFAAVDIVQSDRSRKLTDQIRRRIVVMQNEEHNDLLDREQESRQRAHSTTSAVTLASGVGLVLLVAALLFINRLLRHRERVQAALHNAERVQRAILNSANHSMISTDVTGRILTTNAAAQKWLHYSQKELIGASICVLHDSRELQARAEGLGKAMGMTIPSDFQALIEKAKYGVPDSIECSYVRKNGERFPVSLSVTALRNEAGELSGYLMIATDISERRKVERMKDEFVSVVSHELRTPLTSIKGALGLLAGGAVGTLPESGRRMLQLALNNTERLTRLVNDILDLDRIESGRLALHKETYAVAALMRESASSVRVLAESAHVVVEAVPAGHAVEVDSGRMVQVFVNLLGNAIKFSSPGSKVVFAAETRGDTIIFTVKDRGRGIPADKLDRVFERFEQVDASDSREKGGSGLGLAICRGIVQQHGGRIWAESELGLGSTFSVELPLAVSEPVAARA